MQREILVGVGGAGIGFGLGWLTNQLLLGLKAPEAHKKIIDEMVITDVSGVPYEPKLVDVGKQDRMRITPAEMEAPRSVWLFTQTGTYPATKAELKNITSAIVGVWGTVSPVLVEVAKLTGDTISVFYKGQWMFDCIGYSTFNPAI